MAENSVLIAVEFNERTGMPYISEWYGKFSTGHAADISGKLLDQSMWAEYFTSGNITSGDVFYLRSSPSDLKRVESLVK